MTIFSRVKAQKAKKVVEPAEPVVPFHERELYVPKYAVRDAMHCSPANQKRDHTVAMKKAHEDRAARIEYEKSLQYFALSNPKLVVSRGSSGRSTPFSSLSRRSSTRFTNPFASSTSSSSGDLTSLGPRRPQRPAIQHFAPDEHMNSFYGFKDPESFTSSPRSSPLSTPSSTSPIPSLRGIRSRPDPRERFAESREPAKTRPAVSFQAPLGPSVSPPAALPKLDFRKSINTEDTWAALSIMMDKMSTEPASGLTSEGTVSDRSSDVSSLYSTDGFSDNSTQPSPIIEEIDNFSSTKLGKMPVTTYTALPAITKTMKRYAVNSVDGPSIPPRSTKRLSPPRSPPRSPSRSTDGASIASSTGSRGRLSMSPPSMINAF